MQHRPKFFYFLFLFVCQFSWAQYDDRDFLDLVDEDDSIIAEKDPVELKRETLKAVDLNLTEKEELDDLESLREDIGEIYFEDTNIDPKKIKKALTEEGKDNTIIQKKEGDPVGDIPEKDIPAEYQSLKNEKVKIFDVGKEEKELLKLSKLIENKIPEKQWNEVAKTNKSDKYVIVEGEYLWKISQKLFGSGFYYPKIWSLNPYITNPHEVKPGMVLIFTTGDEDSPPEIKLGSFDDDIVFESKRQGKKFVEKLGDFGRFGEDARPPWIKEKAELLKQGVFIQYATEETYEDLADISKSSLVTEFKKYSPPDAKIKIYQDAEEIVPVGFDKESKVATKFKEGFFLNTFVTSNIVQDFGEITDAKKAGMFQSKHDTVYVKFDALVSVAPGDMFSVYSADGKISHEVSDREGYKYTIVGQIKAIQKISDKWECLITDSTGVIQRHDRITVHTPRIGQLITSFNARNIEAAVIGGYNASMANYATGDVLYLDRGRADGLELGNVLEAFSFIDQGTEKRITYNPTYKIGEISVITLTDNFATGLVTNAKDSIALGSLLVTKNKEQAARDYRIKNEAALNDVRDLEKKSLDELDVELNLDDLADDLLDKADKIQLTEDELEELERQEREKSIIKDSEKDLRALERLEEQIEDAEVQLNESKVDEDRLLEHSNLDSVEKDDKSPRADAFESLNEIEKEQGRKYLDENLNSKENPYGLTEFDLEEIDELLNLEQK